MFEIFLIDPEVVRQSKVLTVLGAQRLKEASYLGSAELKNAQLPSIIFTEISYSNRLGYYDSTQNLIVLSSTLAEGRSSAELEQVYMHELAHFCDYVINGESAHDATFRAICSALNVEEHYAAAAVAQTAEQRQKIKSRIEKLLNLSESDFEGEATLAMQKARNLMEKYGLKEAEEKDILYGVHAETMKSLKTWKGVLSAVVCRSTGAFPLFDRTAPGQVCLSFYGTMEQVEVSLYMYDSLMGTIMQKCEEAVKIIKEKAPGIRINRDQICQGLVDGFSRANAGVQSTALTLSKKNNANKYRRITESRFSSANRSYRTTSQYEMGLSSGKSISMPGGGKMTKRIT